MERNKLIYNENDICIIGMSGEFPKAHNITEYWENLVEGRDCIERFGESSDDNYVAAYGVLDDSYRFDNEFFGISNFDAEKMDIQQRRLIENVYRAVENAGYADFSDDKKIVTGLFCGSHDVKCVWDDVYLNHIYDKEKSAMLGMYTGSAVATRIAYQFNFTGPCMTFNAACATGLVGINLAVKSLKNHECYHCVVAAASIEPHQNGYYIAENAISSDGYTCAYDRNGTGFVPGSAVAAVVLKRYGDAVRDGDNILGVIKAVAVGNDGNRKVGFAAPSIHGEYEVISRAMKDAHITADDVVYIEGHGTATPLGDSVEISALKKAFGERKESKLLLGSVKSNIGHTDLAAGLAGLIKVLCSFSKNIIPYSINCKCVSEEIDEHTPISIVRENTSWGDNAKIAGVSAFGIGGVNAHLIIQEPPERDNKNSAERVIIPLSAKSEPSLSGAVNDLSCFLTNTDSDIKTIAETYMKKPEMKYRTFLTGSTSDEISKARSYINTAFPEGKAKVVFIIPGGGSQFDDMGIELYHKNKVFRNYMDECLGILKENENVDLSFHFSGENNRKFTVSEGICLIFCMNYSLAKFVMSMGIKPSYLFGSSLGEYAAACLSGAMPLESALKVIAERGRLIENTEKGAMLSVPLDKETTEKIIEGTGTEISAINFVNRILVSGREADIEKARKKFEENGYVVNYMNVETAGHCCLVDGILDGIEKAVSEVKFEKIRIPVLSSFKADFIDDDTISDSLFWRNHTREKVNFFEAAQKLMDIENLVFVEIGTGMQLSTFIRKIFNNHKSNRVVSLIPYSDSPEYEQVMQAIGEIWSAGVKIDWSILGFGNNKTYVPSYHFSGNEFVHKVKAESTCVNGNVLIYDGLKNSSYEKSEYIVSRTSGRVIFVEDERERYVSQCGTDKVFEILDSLKNTCCMKYFDNSNIRLLSSYGSYETDANRLAASCIMDYLKSSENFDINDVYTIDKLMDVTGAEKESRPFIDYFLCFLSDYGYINMEHGMFRFLPESEKLPDKNTVLKECREKYPDCCAYMELCVYVSDRYRDIFSGKIKANEVLYPDGRFDLIKSYENRMPLWSYIESCTSSVAEIVCNAVKQSGRKVRILEVGGGTGELTNKVIDALEGLDYEYCFTDIGMSFVSDRRKLDKDEGRTNIEYGVFDVSRSPDEQGFSESQFDIIICLDVIQATADISKSLENIKYLLADDGLFLMAETCTGSEIVNMIFGCAPGWWNYYYDPLRNRITMSPDRWQKIIEKSGFRQTSYFPGDRKSDSFVFVARNREIYNPAENIFRSTEKNRSFKKISTSGKDVQVIFKDKTDMDSLKLLAAETGCSEIVTDDKIRNKNVQDSQINGNEKDSEISLIISIVEDILGVSNVSGSDRLIDIGFDSLSEMILASRIKENFNVQAGIADLFGCDTVEDILTLIRKSDTAETTAELETSEKSELSVGDLFRELGI
ncbi:MAG: acyltransferase domain-containing protein [Lachnospiraceae bacterium]|nr:acyltransferase domain-containing protein [Lachnospiraceae bacterium]MCM1231339.1 acyltransferase domain-containing protein [Ruminococcus flavefaciens]